LQPQSQTFCASLTVNFRGVNSVVLCEPSQNGWRFERPQAHQKYSPGASSTAYGDRWATVGSGIVISLRGRAPRRDQKPEIRN
jgi:hypothetical protein